MEHALLPRGYEALLAARESFEQAIEYETYDASYVEAILHQRRRQRELPSPTEVLPRCPEWIEETDYEPTGQGPVGFKNHI